MLLPFYSTFNTISIHKILIKKKKKNKQKKIQMMKHLISSPTAHVLAEHKEIFIKQNKKCISVSEEHYSRLTLTKDGC